MTETVWQGRFLEMVKDGDWEYAARRDDIDAAVIVAFDGDDLLLVEQMRVPLGRPCLELPAGLVGDEGHSESIEAAAARELEEETGYRAAAIEPLGEFHSSPGMTNERFTIVRATGLTQVGPVEDGITLHKVPLADLPAFVAARRKAGIAVDAKLLLVLSLETLANASTSSSPRP